MKCPHCQQTFFAGWKVYFAKALGDRLCPHCGETSRLSYHWTYWLRTLIVLLLVTGVPTLFVLSLGPGRIFDSTLVQFVATFLLFMVIFGIPVDRYLDNHFRALRKKERRPES